MILKLHLLIKDKIQNKIRYTIDIPALNYSLFYITILYFLLLLMELRTVTFNGICFKNHSWLIITAKSHVLPSTHLANIPRCSWQFAQANEHILCLSVHSLLFLSGKTWWEGERDRGHVMGTFLVISRILLFVLVRPKHTFFRLLVARLWLVWTRRRISFVLHLRHSIHLFFQLARLVMDSVCVMLPFVVIRPRPFFDVIKQRKNVQKENIY